MEKNILKIGVIGGLGPIASASFIETIYTHYLTQLSVQDKYCSPNIYLYSEPLTSQSTAVMSLIQTEVELLEKLSVNIDKLLELDVDYIIVCCFTAHALLTKLSQKQQTRILSLVPLVLKTIQLNEDKAIFLSAASARQATVLENHILWEQANKKIGFITESQQQELNEFIYCVKTNKVTTEVLEQFLAFLNKLSSSHFIVGCAELHVLHKRLKEYFGSSLSINIIDPFHLAVHQVFLI
jgi:aspartate racemase